MDNLPKHIEHQGRGYQERQHNERFNTIVLLLIVAFLVLAGVLNWLLPGLI